MSDARISSRADAAAPAGAAPRADAGIPGGPTAIATADGLALSRPAATPPRATFSWARAGARFRDGVKAQARETWAALTGHPLRTLAGVAAFTGLTMGLAWVGVSPAAFGNFTLLVFGGLASFRLGRAVVEAFGDWRRGEMAEAEAGFEAIGRGGFDVALTLGPAAAGRAFSIVRRTEAGQAIAAVWRETRVGQAVAGVTALPGRAWRFVRTSAFGELKAAPGQAEALAGSAANARALNRALAEGGRLAATRARLDAWRLAIAESGSVRGFNFVFEGLPARFDGWAITQINYSSPGRAVRDWGIRNLAVRRAAPGVTPAEALRALEESRLHGFTQADPLQRFAVVGDKLVRGSAPTTQAHFEQLKAKGVDTVVSLLHPNNPKEVALLAAERQLAEANGMKFVNLPLPFGVDPPPEMVARFLTAVDGTRGAVYVHCRLGRDRTGAMVAVYRMAREGRSNAAAYAEMREFGFRPEHDTYLGYLRDYVLKFGRGAADRLRGFFLAGSARDVARAGAEAAPAVLRRD